ncbi:general stress protein [Schaalia turicensis]
MNENITTGASATARAAEQSAADYRTITEVSDYRQAERLVDALSDAGFPVENVRIVGVNLESVEQVTGRLTTGKAALYGAAGGASWGLFFSFFFILFAPAVVLWQVLLFGLACGAVLGAIMGAISHGFTGGRRDFASVRATIANSYEVQVRRAFVNEAYATLAQAGYSVS